MTAWGRFRRRPAQLMLAALIAGSTQSPQLPAADKEPAVPPGKDPGGVAIAILATGFDYTDMAVAPYLARDGEGELIGWDFVDNDRKPYAPSPDPAQPLLRIDGTTLAKLLSSAAPRARIVPLRVDPSNATSLARALAFLSRTPVRIAVVPYPHWRQEQQELFRLAAARLPHLLLIAAAPDDVAGDTVADPGAPRARDLDNLATVAMQPLPHFAASQDVDAFVESAVTMPGALAPQDAAHAAVLAAAALAGCGPDLSGLPTGRELKEILLTRLAKPASAGPPPVIATCGTPPTER